MSNEYGLVPFGEALQADTVVLRTALASVLGMTKNGLADGEMSVEDLQTVLENIQSEVIQALKDEVVAKSFKPIQGVGGFDGEPKVEWG